MLKEITVSNLLNFRNDVTLDFTTTEEKNNIYNKPGKENISVISLIYGKNNVGKSNLLRILGQSSEFVLEGENEFTAFKPSGLKTPSLVEFVFENEENEIRYGFELDTFNDTVLDEWMFSKVDGSTRESRIFERSENYYSNYFKAADVKHASEVKDSTLVLHHFSTLNNNINLINETLMFFNSIKLMNCDSTSEDGGDNLVTSIMGIKDSEKKMKVLNTFLKTSDLDVSEIRLTSLGKDESLLMYEFSELRHQALNEDEYKNKVSELIEKNPKLFINFVERNIINVMDGNTLDESFALEFIHKSGASFKYLELSSGTRQLLNVISKIIDRMDKQSILLFDEIENGLHNDLLFLIMDLLKLVAENYDDIQIIATTHSEDLLDYDYISNQNKVFMKVNSDFEIGISYLSEYKLREYQLPSQRYKLNAFKTNPNTNNEYELTEIFEGIDRDA